MPGVFVTAAPARRPCASCPYRRDVPSGLWETSEYDKLPAYDLDTAFQPMRLFFCHQQDGRLCAGWVGCHDMDNSLALRMGAVNGRLTPEEIEIVLAYTTDVALFESGTEAATHGMTEIDEPDDRANRAIDKLLRARTARSEGRTE